MWKAVTEKDIFSTSSSIFISMFNCILIVYLFHDCQNQCFSFSTTFPLDTECKWNLQKQPAKVHLKACNFVKKRLQYRCFPVDIAKFLRTPILKSICKQLLLNVDNMFKGHPGRLKPGSIL